MLVCVCAFDVCCVTFPLYCVCLCSNEILEGKYIKQNNELFKKNVMKLGKMYDDYMVIVLYLYSNLRC